MGFSSSLCTLYTTVCPAQHSTNGSVLLKRKLHMCPDLLPSHMSHFFFSIKHYFMIHVFFPHINNTEYLLTNISETCSLSMQAYAGCVMGKSQTSMRSAVCCYVASLNLRCLEGNKALQIPPNSL